MKDQKRFAALALSAVMVFSMAGSVSAAQKVESANYAQTECQFRYCGTAIPFLTVRSTAR